MLAKRDKVTWLNTQETVNARENCSHHGYIPTQNEYNHQFFVPAQTLVAVKLLSK